MSSPQRKEDSLGKSATDNKPRAEASLFYFHMKPEDLILGEMMKLSNCKFQKMKEQSSDQN